MPVGTVKLDMRPLKRFAAEVRRDLRTNGSGPIRQMLRQWGRRYLGFTKKRFLKLSRGGGDWKALAPSTIRGRRKPRGTTARSKTRRTGGKAAILRNTGTLVAALSVGGRGNMFKDIPNGVRVGFQGGVKHPSGKATIAEIAVFHNVGGRGGKPPQRAILVEPDRATIRAMEQDGVRAVGKLLRKHDMGRGVR